MSITCFGRCRSPVSVMAITRFGDGDQAFRLMSITP
jgi:hypothetical protein